MRIYPLIHEVDTGLGDLVDDATERLMLHPAERATLLSTGWVQINDMLVEPLIVQIEAQPEEYAHSEWMNVDDYGNVTRRWTRPGLGTLAGKVQL